MAKTLFWNINKKDLTHDISALCHEKDVDLLVLAESTIPPDQLMLALNDGVSRKYLMPFNLSERLSFFIRYPLDCFAPLLDEGGVAIRLLRPPAGQDVIVVAVHLPSKHNDPDAPSYYARRLSHRIDEVERQVGHTRTVVVGDLNMNPFEAGVAGADGLHAVMDRQIASKGQRIVKGSPHKFFYNPMWSRLGDASLGPPGTYYYYRGDTVSYYWHTFDQVLVRPDLLDYFPEDAVTVVQENKGVLSKSDHFPILFSLDIEREI